MNTRGREDTVGTVSWEARDIGTRHLRITKMMERGMAITKGEKRPMLIYFLTKIYTYILPCNFFFDMLILK